MRNIILSLVLLATVAAGHPIASIGRAWTAAQRQTGGGDPWTPDNLTGAVSYISFDLTGSVVVDSIGGGTGTVTQCDFSSDYGVRGVGMYATNGTSSKIDFGNYSVMNFFGNPFTISFWTRLPDTTHFGTLMGKLTSQGFVYSVQLSTDLFVYRYLPEAQVVTTNVFTDNEWYFITTTKDSSNVIRTYINANQIGITTNSTAMNSSGSFAFGELRGQIDEFRAWNNPLTPEDIMKLYNYDKP